MCLEQSVLNNTTHTKKHRKSLKKHFILSLRNPAVILDKFGLTSKKQQLMMAFSFLIIALNHTLVIWIKQVNK